MTPEEEAKAKLAEKRAKAQQPKIVEATTEDKRIQEIQQNANIRQKLLCIQSCLRVGKNRGLGHTPGSEVKYEYRNAEDILEAVKPLCAEVAAVVTVDVQPLMVGESSAVEIREVRPAAKDMKTGVAVGSPTYSRLVGPRFVALATATLSDCTSGESISCRAFAEIDFWRKGQTEPEKLCGSADSYASKYALAHLFALDNNRDADMESDQPAVPPNPGF